MDNSALPIIFLHNAIAIIVCLVLSGFIRIRWLSTIISWIITMAVSFAWKDIGYKWANVWIAYLYRPIFEGDLWNKKGGETEITGLLLFWLMPLAIAYVAALTRIHKITK